jgi:GT2 family glycosyltransferase
MPLILSLCVVARPKSSRSEDVFVGADGAKEIEVSIIICTRNRGSRLSGTLAALKALRTQRTYEVIWVDNASTDNTAAVLRNELANDPAARLIFCERIGLGAARNEGWKASCGEIVAFTDDDCYPAPDYVDALIATFSDYPEVGLIGGRILLYNPRHARITIEEGQTPRRFPRRSYVRGGLLQGANLAFRRAALSKINGIDPELGAGTPFPCEDTDAVNSVLWAGFDGVFDPRPTVQHNHGRTEDDLPALLDSYSRGRGGLFAKYILRPDTRATFALRWLGSARHRLGSQGLHTLMLEMVSAAKYTILKGRYDILCIAAPICLMVLAFQAFVSLFLAVGQTLRIRGAGS